MLPVMAAMTMGALSKQTAGSQADAGGGGMFGLGQLLGGAGQAPSPAAALMGGLGRLMG
jgi:hypothetical protein